MDYAPWRRRLTRVVLGGGMAIGSFRRLRYGVTA
jgi:hypothetical protein